MPKMKTKSAAKKRFKVTATGKIKRACSGKNHILTKKDRKRKNNLCDGGYAYLDLHNRHFNKRKHCRNADRWRCSNGILGLIFA